MNDTLTLRERLEKDANLQSVVARLFRRDGVPKTAELRRIVALPRRVWEQEPSLAELMTAYLRTEQGQITLWERQARVLSDLHDYGGAVALLKVGDGKTIVSFLAPRVLEVERALLIVPAKLRRKTIREFKVLAKHFDAKPPMIVSYEKISRGATGTTPGGTEFLAETAPKLLILDECHRVKNRAAAVTRRITQYMADHEDCRMLAMSGTVTKRSLHDFAHILAWSLGDRLMPLPCTHMALDPWAAAVDVIKPNEARFRADPGALEQLYNDEEHALSQTDKLGAVRRAVRRRIIETPGVIASESTSEVDASLNVTVHVVEGYNPTTHALFEKLYNGQLPNDDPVTEENLSARWRACRSLTSGFWYTWDPEPPEEWLEARRAWKKVARALLGRHLRGLESEGVLVRVILRGELYEKFHVSEENAQLAADLYQEWVSIRDTFRPNPVAVWEDDRMLDAIAAWTRHNTGIVWVSEAPLGKKLHDEGIVPYYGREGLDRDGKFIEDHKAKDGPIAASVGSNSEGRNLQHQWSKNLIISPPPTGTVMEQLLGRTHRNGQQSDEVECDIYIGCQTEWECWQQARTDSAYGSDIEGKKKLSYCSITEPENFPTGNYLWRQNNGV